MCELLGMDCNVPTDIVFSFTALALRGGMTGPHADGWGLALYDGPFAQVFLEPRPACDSQLARFLRENPTPVLLAVAHVRQRTDGGIGLANTHPFKRVFWGRDWVFAHNGTLPAIKHKPLRRFAPVGSTDSEYAFCWLLDQLEQSFGEGEPEDASAVPRRLAELGGEIGAEGSFNFLLGDGHRLFARCGTRLCYIIRQAPFGPATLKDADIRIDFSAVTTPRDRVAVVATNPLTRDESWCHAKPGTLWVFADGALQSEWESRDPHGRPESPPLSNDVESRAQG